MWQVRSRQWFDDYWKIAVVVVSSLVALWAVALDHWQLVIGNSEPFLYLTDLLIMVGPELAGLAIAVVVLEEFNERRAEQQLKEVLIAELGSPHGEISDRALRQMATKGWVSDGSLRGAFLERADLKDQGGPILLTHADLREAEMFGVKLTNSNLHGAKLDGATLDEAILAGATLSLAHLKRAKLRGAHFDGADLMEASLDEAEMWLAKLPEAYCREASFQGADLTQADFEGADLIGAKMQNTILSGTVFRNARLENAIFTGAVEWTVEQFEATEDREGMVMPDNIRLFHEHEHPTGLSLEQWKAMQGVDG